MSEVVKVPLGKDVQTLETSPKFDGYSGVEIVNDDGTSTLVGNTTGRVLKVSGISTSNAQALLDRIKGFRYQPYDASGALLNPAAEIGDGVTVNGAYSGIYKMTKKFSQLMAADIAAPQDEELDHEYPYEPKQDRIFKREIQEAYSRITQTENAITLEVARASATEGTLSTIITQNANSITTEVNARKSADTNLSTRITQTENSITSEVTRATKAESTLRSSIQQNADSISAKVSKTGGSSSTFGWKLTDSAWTVSGNGKTIFKVDNSGAQITGKVVATSGKIGAFDITSSYISTNGKTSRDDTIKDGVYIGSNGIALGKGNFRVGSDGVVAIGGNNFRVDASGNVKANNITLTGELNIGGQTITAAALRNGAAQANASYGTWNGTSNAWSNATNQNGKGPSVFKADFFNALKGITTDGTTTIKGDLYIQAGGTGQRLARWKTIIVNGVSFIALCQA